MLIRLNSYVRARWYISSDLVKHFVLFRKNWMQRISMHLILVLIIHVLHLAMDANNHIKIAIYKEEKGV